MRFLQSTALRMTNALYLQYKAGNPSEYGMVGLTRRVLRLFYPRGFAQR